MEFRNFYPNNPPEKEGIVVYDKVMRGLENILTMRLQMVKVAQDKGICQSARLYNTTCNTVRKWVNRYREEGLQGLANREPQNIFLTRPQER